MSVRKPLEAVIIAAASFVMCAFILAGALLAVLLLRDARALGR